MTDYYRILQVDPAADPDVIDAAYRRIVFKVHPDRNSAPDAAARFREVQNAYEVLRDPVARAAYDQSGFSKSSRAPHPYFVPAAVDFGELKPGQAKTIDITCNNSGDLALSAALAQSSDASWFSAEVISQAPAEQGYCPIVLRVTARGPGGAGTLCEWLSVTLDGISAIVDLRLTAVPMPAADVAAETSAGAARGPSRKARQRDELQALEESIAHENVEIARGWKMTVIAVAIDGAAFLIGTIGANASNNNIGTRTFGGWFAGCFGSLAAIVFGLAAWAGVLIVLGMVLYQIGNTIIRTARVARLKAKLIELSLAPSSRDVVG
ncbi:MAG TPA: J domain-containing protein [Thermoanaerobaculia bacterium]|jgi:hypothetical protein